MALADEQMINLQTKLSSFSQSTVVFSYSLWSLVTGVHSRPDEINTFRNNVLNFRRKIAHVYVDKVLPMTESVIEEISNLADYFTLLDFKDWSHSDLEEMLSDIEKAQGKCVILKRMYRTIAINLKLIVKTNSTSYHNGHNMEKLTTQYKHEEEYLRVKAQQLMEIPSCEWGLMEFRKFDVDWPGFLSISELQLENEKALVLTKESLIPSVEEFIRGVEYFSLFFAYIKECLTEMMNVEKSANEPSFKTIKKHFGQLGSESMKFLRMANIMCSKMFSIPTDPNDKNYVDEWFHHQEQMMQCLELELENNNNIFMHFS